MQRYELKLSLIQTLGNFFCFYFAYVVLGTLGQSFIYYNITFPIPPLFVLLLRSSHSGGVRWALLFSAHKGRIFFCDQQKKLLPSSSILGIVSPISESYSWLDADAKQKCEVNLEFFFGLAKKFTQIISTTNKNKGNDRHVGY